MSVEAKEVVLGALRLLCPRRCWTGVDSTLKASIPFQLESKRFIWQQWTLASLEARRLGRKLIPVLQVRNWEWDGKAGSGRKRVSTD